MNLYFYIKCTGKLLKKKKKKKKKKNSTGKFLKKKKKKKKKKNSETAHKTLFLQPNIIESKIDLIYL